MTQAAIRWIALLNEAALPQGNLGREIRTSAPNASRQ